jgi:radical SAM protein with 4Fe4S-binding SPASM domain
VVSYFKADELTADEAKQLFCRLAEMDCPVILFSGGEPLLREDLFDLLDFAGSKGLRTVLSTNGTLIDTDTAKKIADAKVSYVGISIDGDEIFHDSFRQLTGCFKAALKGLQNCKKANLRTGLRFTITKANSQYVPFIFSLAADEGVGRICFYHLIRTGRAKALDYQTPNPVETRKVVDTIIDKTAESVAKGLVDEVLTVGNHCDGPYLLLRMQKQTQNFAKAKKLLQINGGNRTGEKIVAIGPDGSVHPDQFWQNYSLGNITQKSFNDIWNNSADLVLYRLRNKRKFADGRCLSCRWFDYCKGNYRFLAADSADRYWLNEPACYLTDDEIKI